MAKVGEVEQREERNAAKEQGWPLEGADFGREALHPDASGKFL